MAGYSGFSMSNNAIAAYENGEKPYSKWTKRDIIEAIEDLIKEEEIILNCSLEKLKIIPVKTLKEMCLTYSSWHHTSNHYNKTDFYSISINKIEELTDDKINKIIIESKSEKEKQITEERWKCAFLEWGGTRKHPVAKEIIEEGIVRGDWFYRKNGTKKKTTANGFRFIEKIQ